MSQTSLLDERQAHLHENFPPGHYLNDPDHVRKFIDWVTFWRRNPGRFVQVYFGVVLHLYQHIILVLMEWFPSICIVAARSAAKSFIIAVYSCKEAILRPGARIVVASATKKQARLIVSEKIKKEILPSSPLLQEEIESIRDSNNEIEVIFKNGSSIVVVAADDRARGYRATVMIYEEFRMIAKNIIDTVLSPFLFARQVPYLQYDEYDDLLEEPKEVFISSAWYRSHWMWDTIKSFTKDMITKQTSAVIAMDYSIALRHKIKTRSFLEKERRKLDPVAWSIEYENQMISENTKAYFTYEMLNKNRVLKRAFYPRKDSDVLNHVRNKNPFHKQKGEIRILSCDIASETGSRNDNSVFCCLRLLPESKEYKTADSSGDRIEIKHGYRRQLVYLETKKGGETTAQAIRIKQLFYDFEADYCVLDARYTGISIYDALAKHLYDEERNVEYTPWTCLNDKEMASRIVIAGQEPVVYAIKASLEINSRIAVCMKNVLENRMIDLLVNHQEGVEEIQRIHQDYATADPETQVAYERPYLETVALINDMIALEYTVMNQTGTIRIEPKHGGRKDRYTSVSYGNYFADLLEKDLFTDSSEYKYLTLCN